LLAALNASAVLKNGFSCAFTASFLAVNASWLIRPAFSPAQYQFLPAAGANVANSFLTEQVDALAKELRLGVALDQSGLHAQHQ
jgi:hypothetical protein